MTLLLLVFTGLVTFLVKGDFMHLKYHYEIKVATCQLTQI